MVTVASLLQIRVKIFTNRLYLVLQISKITSQNFVFTGWKLNRGLSWKLPAGMQFVTSLLR